MRFLLNCVIHLHSPVKFITVKYKSLENIETRLRSFYRFSNRAD